MDRTQRTGPAVSSPGSPPPLPMTRSFTFLARAGVLAALVLALPACDSGTDEPTTGGVDPTGAFTAAAANKGAWAYIPVGGAKCRDGSDTGFGIRLQRGATNTMIYLEGGGACFDPLTCAPAANPSRFGAAEFSATAQTRLTGGIFSTDTSNPVGTWNQVYVPYCTGDIHGGTEPNGAVTGVAGTQQFVGHLNIEKDMRLLGPYLGDQGKVLLVGLSAGGFGSLLNFPTVDSTFSASKTYLLDDSGPILFDDAVLSPLLSGALIGLYRADRALPVPGILQPDGLQNIYAYLATTFPDSRFALASHLEDATIRGFFGFNPATGQRFAISGEAYAAALRDTRSRLPSQWGTYFASGDAHTFVATPALYTGTSAGVALNAYVGNLVNGRVSNVDPVPARPAPLSGVLAAR